MKCIPLLCLISALTSAALAATPAVQKLEVKFDGATAYDTGGTNSLSVAIADLNGSGNLDLVVVNRWQGGGGALGEVAVLLNNGDGTFQSPVTYTTGAYYGESVAVGDVNGDGIPDLVVSNQCLTLNQYGNCAGVGAVSVLLGNGDGTFQPAVPYSTGTGGASSVAIADLRGDGIVDVVVADNCPEGCLIGTLSVLLGNGDGTFQPAVTYGSGGENAESIAVADLNGDGIPDLAVANECSLDGGCGVDGEMGVLLGNGDGTFQPATVYDSGGEYTYSVALGDLRGNGIQDAVVASSVPGGTLGVLLGNGDGTFQPAVTYLAHGRINGGNESLVIGDVNGDGIPDMIVVQACLRLHIGDLDCEGTGQVNVMLGNGDGTFQSPIVYSSGGYYGSGIAIADVNGDGRPDMVVTNAEASEGNGNDGSVAVLLNETSYTTKTALTSSPNPAQVNQSVTFTATIASTPPVPNGELVTFYNGKTTLGTAPTTNGAATLTTMFSAAKTYTIKADYPGDPFRKKSSGTAKQVVNN